MADSHRQINRQTERIILRAVETQTNNLTRVVGKDTITERCKKEKLG